MTGLSRTPLFDLHVDLGAKMVAFAGYEMPVQYPMGVMKEHLHARAHAGLFDVSHMGQVVVSGGSWEDVALGFETLVPQDVLGLQDGRQRYGFFTNEGGGIEDDLMFARREDELLVVVNAACKEADVSRMRAGLPAGVTVTELTDRALLALQGPKAGNVMTELDPRAGEMRFMDVADLELSGHSVWASRSGYTGEDGFEITVPDSEAESFWNALLAQDVAPCGLGCRDTLRLEAGMNLYGSDMDETISPLEANMGWTVDLKDEARNFIGKSAIESLKADGVKHKLVGLVLEEKGVLRSHQKVIIPGIGEGEITSGSFSPTLKVGIAMARVPAETTDSALVEMRKKEVPVRVIKPSFVRNGKQVY